MRERSNNHVPEPGAESPIQIEDMTASRVLRKQFIILGALALLACGFMLAQGASWASTMLTGKGRYEASTKVFLSSRPSQLLPQSGSQKQENTGEHQIFQKTQAALLKSRYVLLRALRQSAVSELSMVRDMADSAPEWLEGNLEVDFKESPEIMRISLTGDKPQELTILLQAVTEAYLDEVINDDMKSRTDRLQTLRDISHKYEEDLRTKRQTLKNLAEQVGTGRLSGSEAFRLEVNRQLLSDFKREISRLEISKTAMQAKLKRLNKKGDRAERDAANNLQADIDEKVEQEKLLMESGGNITAQVKELARTDLDLESLRKELQHSEEMVKKLRGEVETSTIELRAPARIRRIGDATPDVKKRKN